MRVEISRTKSRSCSMISVQRPSRCDEVDQDTTDQRALGLGEAGSRLVKQQHTWLQRQHHRQLQRAFHAVGQMSALDRQLPVEASRGDDAAGAVWQRERRRMAQHARSVQPVSGRGAGIRPPLEFRRGWWSGSFDRYRSQPRAAGECAQWPCPNTATVPPVRS